MTSKLVYSTTTGSQSEAKGAEKAYRPSSGPIKMRLESKGRGGKQVTVLFNLTFPTEEQARETMRKIQGSLGVGGTFKDGTIEFRGDVRDRVEAHLSKLGLKLVRAGG